MSPKKINSKGIDATLKDTEFGKYIANFDYVYPKMGDVVTGNVIEKGRNKVLVDLGGSVTGIILGKDAMESVTAEVGEKIYAVVVDDQNDEGLLILSIKKASQIQAWDKFQDLFDKKTTIQVKAYEANKGGLLIDVDGVKGFLPVSQLSPINYPRVDGGNSELILDKLNALIGKTFDVRIINIDHDSKKLILSEKEAVSESRDKVLGNIGSGDRVTGVVSSIVSYGLFVTFDGLEGLVHISEIAWGHVTDPKQYAKVGDKVDVQVLSVDNGKISLSMKRLVADPWEYIGNTFKLGDVFESEVTRITPFGVFVRIYHDVNGLVHLSEIAPEAVKDPYKYVKVGDNVKIKIINLDLNENRIGLSMKDTVEGVPHENTKKEDMVQSKVAVVAKTTQKKVEVSDDLGDLASEVKEIKEEKSEGVEAKEEKGEEKPKKAAPKKKKE